MTWLKCWLVRWCLSPLCFCLLVQMFELIKNETGIDLPENCETVQDVFNALDDMGLMVYHESNNITGWELACWKDEIDIEMICYSADAELYMESER